MSERAKKALGFSMITLIIVVAISVGAYSCILPSSDTTLCSNDLRCPPGSKCVERLNVCVFKNCGDGVLDEGEICDDGNNISGDGCSADCLSDETCGNGYVDTFLGEECDDGGVDTESCNENCTKAWCGDGHTNRAANEECDDEGESEHCNSDCTFSRCGDGKINITAREQCDDGSDENGPIDTDYCNKDCTLARCGDGHLNVWAGEECDDGGESAGCNADCTFARCGDGKVNVTAGEECDDGNDVQTDTCPSGPPVRDEDGAIIQETCKWAFCGDGFVWKNVEACDKGIPGEPCSEDCRSDLSCGNGIVDPDEDCDDGNKRNDDACPDNADEGGTCKFARCGDGHEWTEQGGNEECDDGPDNDNQGYCTSGCKLPQCGDGFVNGDEECDPECDSAECGGTCETGLRCVATCECVN